MEDAEVKQLARDGLCRDCKGTGEGLWDCGDEDTCDGFKDECEAIREDQELYVVEDPHVVTAVRIFDVVPGGVTEYMRRAGKAVNFRELYGSARNRKII